MRKHYPFLGDFVQNIYMNTEHKREQEVADEGCHTNEDLIKFLNYELRFVTPDMYRAAINFDYGEKTPGDQRVFKEPGLA